MGILNIISAVFVAVTLIVEAEQILSAPSDSYAASPIMIITIVPSFIIPVIELGLYIYDAFLAFTLEKLENNFSILKRHIIILAIISIFSPFGLLVIIGDIIVFASLLPKYEQYLRSHNSADMVPQNNTQQKV